MGQAFSSCQCLKDNGSVNNSIITEHHQKNNLIVDKNNNSNTTQSQRIKTNQEMLQSNGIPRQGAYNTYIHPPTTVGRQSYIVNQMHQQSGVPKEVWELNDDIFQTNKSYNSGKHLAVRKTQPIQLYRQVNYPQNANSSKYGNNINQSLLKYRRTQPIFNSLTNQPQHGSNLNYTSQNNGFFNNNLYQNNSKNIALISNQPLNNVNSNNGNLVLQHRMLQNNQINQSVTLNNLVSSQTPKYSNIQIFSPGLKSTSFQPK